MRFERRSKLRGLDEVVFDRIAGPQHRGVLEPRQRPDQFSLEIRRQAHGEAVHVDLVDVESFGFEKDLMPLAMREPHDLVFERRAVARTDPRYLSVEQRRSSDVFPH